MNCPYLWAMRLGCLFVLLFCGLVFSSTAQRNAPAYPDTLHKKRLLGVTAGATVITLGTLYGLNEFWYKDYPRSRLHTFDDRKEWLGMDKLGHGFTAYYCGVIGYNSLRWSGLKEKKAVWLGGTWGLAYLTAVELLDGHSAQWGFSWADMAANTSGSLLFIGQQLLWKEQRITPKFSAHATEHAALRPNVLGKGTIQELLKNYNGQTYWLSVNIKSFLAEQSKFPKWLAVSVGYSGTGMLGGHFNPTINSDGNPLPTFTRERQLFLSLDLDLHRIHTRSKFLNGMLKAASYIKFPLPTIEFNSHQGVRFYPIYF